MVDNVALGADGHTNHILHVMRQSEASLDLSSNVEFLPGLVLRTDPSLELTGTAHSPEGTLLAIDAQMKDHHGSWCGLHINLPAKDLTHNGVIGFAARIKASGLNVARACIRSGTDDGFADCFFDKHLMFRSDEASHIDGMSISCSNDLPLQAPWRELVFFLPTRSFNMTFVDLRVFVV